MMLQLIVSMGLHLENVILLFDAEIALSCLAQGSEKGTMKLKLFMSMISQAKCFLLRLVFVFFFFMFQFPATLAGYKSLIFMLTSVHDFIGFYQFNHVLDFSDDVSKLPSEEKRWRTT